MKINPQKPDLKPKWYLTHKFLYPVLGVLVLIVVVGSYFWWQEIKKSSISGKMEQNSIDQISDWKTYEDSELGFRMNYPQDWSVNKDDKWIDFEASGKHPLGIKLETQK